ncbi:MAG: ABC transporter permease [Verrucomicrobiota bacterium]|jgi:ABC-2 type transport system permease protein
MRFAFLVAWREYAENAKTRGFWIGLFMFPVIIFLSISVSVLLETKGTPVRHYVLVDQSGQFASVVESRLEKLTPPALPGAPASKAPQRPFQPATVPAMIDTKADLASLARDLKPWLRGDKNVEANGREVKLDAAILIPRDIEKQIVRPRAKLAGKTAASNGIEYWTANLADTRLRDEIEQAVNGEIRRREYLARGLDSAVIREVEQTHAPFASLNPKKEAGREAVSGVDIIRQWAPSGFVYLLWVAIFTISQMLLNNIIEEKSNRIIEVLLSSVTPGELMMGKLLGIAAIGLTLVGAWMAALFGALSWNSGGAPDIAGQFLLALKTSNLVPMFLIYFLLGYVMYAAFILALGSVCNTIKESQNYMAMITMAMMVPLLTMTFIPKDPNGTLARVLSWIPIYTPFTMMNRVNADPPLVDLIGTTVLLLASTAAALWMAGKVFRIGILRTGQPPKIVEMFRWIKG